MDNKERSMTKEAYEEAVQEEREKQKKEIKKVISTTLERIRDREVQKEKIEQELKILKKDVEDFKEGRLDRIEERQKVDARACEISVVRIEKQEPPQEIHYHNDRWYHPYKMVWHSTPTVLCTNSTGNAFTLTDSVCDITSTSSTLNTLMVNCSVVKDFAPGVYTLASGKLEYV